MISTISESLVLNQAEKYKELLTAYLPKVIKNEQALAIVEDLMHRSRTPEENELYQLLEDSGKTKTDLQVVLGSQTVIDEILQGEAKNTPQQAKKIAEFFHVDPSLFVEG